MRRFGRSLLVILLGLALMGCVSYPEWGPHPGPPEPSPTTTTTTTTMPAAPEHKPLCGHFLVGGTMAYRDWACWVNPPNVGWTFVPDKPDAGQPGELPVCETEIYRTGAHTNCWELIDREWIKHEEEEPPPPPDEGEPEDEPEDEPVSPPAGIHTNCGYHFTSEPIRVDRNLPKGVPLIGPPGRQMFKSACTSTEPIHRGPNGIVGGNGSCFADHMAPGTNPELVAELRRHECFWGVGIGRYLGPDSKPPEQRRPGYDECYLYEPSSRVVYTTASVNKDGFFIDEHFDAASGDVAIDAAGRPVSYKGGTPHLLAWRGQDGEILFGGDVAHGWGRNSLVPPLVDRACSPEEPEPEEPEPVEGCDVGFIGVDWKRIPQKDRCPVPGPHETPAGVQPKTANTDIEILAGKHCVFRLEASSREYRGGPHVGDKPGCFLSARPRWYQSNCTPGDGGDCVDLGGRDPSKEVYGQWDPVGNDGPAWAVHFEVSFPTHLKIQACWPDNKAPGHVCSREVQVNHR
jgi:hypothetical protein